MQEIWVLRTCALLSECNMLEIQQAEQICRAHFQAPAHLFPYITQILSRFPESPHMRDIHEYIIQSVTAI